MREPFQPLKESNIDAGDAERKTRLPGGRKIVEEFPPCIVPECDGELKVIEPPEPGEIVIPG